MSLNNDIEIIYIYNKCKKIIKDLKIPNLDPEECNLEIALAMKETNNSKNDMVLANALIKHLKENFKDHKDNNVIL